MPMAGKALARRIKIHNGQGAHGSRLGQGTGAESPVSFYVFFNSASKLEKRRNCRINIEK